MDSERLSTMVKETHQEQWYVDKPKPDLQPRLFLQPYAGE